MRSTIGCLVFPLIIVLLRWSTPGASFTPQRMVLQSRHQTTLSVSLVNKVHSLQRRPQHNYRFALWMSDDANGETKENTNKISSSSSDNNSSDEELSRLQKIKRKLFPPKPDDGLTFRQRLAKAGLSVVLSYGWVSNVSYAITVSLAWYIFSKQKGLSPLAPGQWKPFLAVYAGFWVFNNIVRPVRFALSVGVSMYFENVVSAIQKRFNVNKSVAVALTVFFANVVGTITLMCGGIALASMAAGVPVFPPKA